MRWSAAGERIVIKKTFVTALLILSSAVLLAPFGSAAAVDPTTLVSGKIVETMDASGYTYALLDTGTEKRWIAGPATALKVGDEIQTDGGMPMNKFHSNSMDRDFDVVYFVAGIKNVTTGASSAAPQMPVAPAANSQPPAVVKVKALKEGENIAALFADPDKYNGKQFALRGTVVKFNSNIMGKNWIHLQDGSGETAGRNGDLTVTTSDTAAVGDVVIATGVIVLEKDFGAGYSYPILMEEAKVKADK